MRYRMQHGNAVHAEYDGPASRIGRRSEVVGVDALTRCHVSFDRFRQSLSRGRRLQHGGSDCAPNARGSDNIQRDVERAAGHAHRSGDCVQICSHLPSPREGTPAIEENHRFTVALRRSRREEVKCSSSIRRCVERVGCTLIESLPCVFQCALEGANRTFRRANSFAAFARTSGSAWERRSSYPHRNQKQGNRRRREDCASPHAPASYIRTIS